MAAPDLSTRLEVADIQGLLASGYGHLTAACFLTLAVTDPARAAAWLGCLAPHVADATGRRTGSAVHVALSPSGLRALGLPRAALVGFSDRFQEGMAAPHRSRALGDEGVDAPEHWDWGGPRTAPVDVLLLLYAEDGEQLAALARRHAGAPTRDGLTLIRRLDTEWSDREHFGFRDGIAQPVVAGLGAGRAADTVQAGEFILGYPNEYGARTERPLLRLSADPASLLPADADGSGLADLGRNGSYLVVRQLSQDVRSFWAFVDHESGGAGLPEDASLPEDPGARIALAAKMVGRWPDGAPLVLVPDDPGRSGGATDDFAYHRLDPHGLRCPLGAHIRRSHPRDMLDPDPGSESSVAIDKRHRLLRRGRSYGPPLTASVALNEALNGGAAGDDERGLHFICLCANLARQFEFVQQTWINNPKFGGLYDDPDPLLGRAKRSFTIQAEPVRRRVTGLPAFVGMRGGGYFFLPGLRALRYLASLGAG